MTILLPTLAAAFAALCVWLTVRIVNRRERWAKWTLAGLVGVPVLYVLSFGPACWIASHATGDHDVLLMVYRPLVALMAREYSFNCHNRKPSSERGRTATTIALNDELLGQYADLFASEDMHWIYFWESEDPKGEPPIIVKEIYFFGKQSEHDSLVSF